METYNWKICQHCGGKTISAEVPAMRECRVVCIECGSSEEHAAAWDDWQASTRARKRFELVKALVGSGADFNDSDFQIAGVDVWLNSLYGPEPEGGE